jgi:hypothetical protein
MKMRNIFLLAVIVLLILVLPLSVLADDAAKYNFASAQGDKEIAIKPGSEGMGAIYFYNIDGNRITHITLEVAEVPEGWTVTVEPPTSETKLLVNDMPVTVTENLYVEPTELLSEEPQDVPEDMVSIKIPGRGYALGRVANVTVEVPEGVEYGTTGTIVVAAEAAWLGQGGAAAVKQARDFEFAVTVVSGKTGYTETIVGDEYEQVPEESEADMAGEVEQERDKSSGLLENYRWVPIAVAVVAIAVIIGVVLSRRRAVR